MVVSTELMVVSTELMVVSTELELRQDHQRHHIFHVAGAETGSSDTPHIPCSWSRDRIIRDTIYSM
jgi:hypothetical protein